MQKNVTKNVVMIVTILAVIFNILLCSNSIAATNNVTIALQQKTAYSGDIVNINISCSQISSGTKIGAYSYEITYDASVLEVIDNEDVFLGEAASGSMHSINFSETGKIKVAGMTTTGISNTGVIGILSFKVISQNLGSTSISLNITKMITTDFDDITYSVGTQGKITIIEEVVPEVEESITLNKSSITLDKGKSQTITASNSNVVWSTSNKSVATVVNGKITAVGVGTAKITATLGNSTAICTVVVNEIILEDTITPETENDTNSNTSTGTSTENNSEEVEDEEVEDENEEELEETKEDVEEEIQEETIKLESIQIKNKNINFVIGEEYILEYILNPQNTTQDYEIVWLSSNKDIAKISNDGVLTINKEGIVTIRVYANNKVYDTYEINIASKNNENYILGIVLSLILISLLVLLSYILVNLKDFNIFNKFIEKIKNKEENEEKNKIKIIKIFKDKYKKITTKEPKLLNDKK